MCNKAGEGNECVKQNASKNYGRSSDEMGRAVKK